MHARDFVISFRQFGFQKLGFACAILCARLCERGVFMFVIFVSIWVLCRIWR